MSEISLAKLKRLDAEAARKQQALERRIAIKKSATDLIEFTKLFMPDPQGIADGDPMASRFIVENVHRFLAGKVKHALLSPDAQDMALSIPPQHAKSTLSGEMAIPFYMGHFPHKSVIYGAFSEDRAREVGNAVKNIMLNPLYLEVFPGAKLRADSKSAEQMTTEMGGKAAFIGRGGAGTGKPADLLIIDDPIKNYEEARSPSIIEALHNWYFSVAETRCHGGTRKFIIQTRWVVDDLIGRLCDPAHPDYDFELAMGWDYVNIPAVIYDAGTAYELNLPLTVPTDPLVIKMFGARPCTALWPRNPALPPLSRCFPLETLARKKKLNPKLFESLYQGNPTPEDGSFFTKSMIVEYAEPGVLPKHLVLYGASDHAITEKKENDPSCLGCVGVDTRGDLWVLPDIVWSHMEPDKLVEAIVGQMSSHKPQYWFAESDLIGKTLGPALRRRQQELKAWTTVIGVPITGDKRAKAANFQARASLRTVHFPSFAPWWVKAKAQLLKFPDDKHDDFVDFVGLVCRGLDYVHKAPTGKKEEETPEPGTIGWIKWAAKREKKQEEKHGRHYASL